MASSSRGAPQRMLVAMLLFSALGVSMAYMPTPLFSRMRLQPRNRLALCNTRMGPVSANDFHPGVTIQIDGNVYKIVEHLHVKPGKGAAFVRTKLKNLSNGGSLEKTFRAGEMVEGADLEKKNMQFNYMDAGDFVFLDMESFETETVKADTVGDSAKWLKEGTPVSILKFGDRILDIEIPMTMVLEVTESDPGSKGNTASSGAEKPAKLETGAEIKVPLFITVGEKVKVDTATGKYLGRAKE